MPEDIAGHRKWLKETTDAKLRQFAAWRRRIKIALVIGGGLIAGFSSPFANFVDQSHKSQVYFLQIIGALLVFAGGVVMEFFDEGAADAIKRANDLADAADESKDQIRDLWVDFEWFTRLYSAATALFYIVEEAVVSGVGTNTEQATRFGAMLDVIIAEKTTLFGMDSDRWNFAIYLYDADDNLLHCNACRRPIRAEEEAKHRSWKPGEGHVGIAFQTKREIVASDTSEPEARALFDGPDPSMRDVDRARYRSIASIPIRLGGAPPVGILVATSDVPGRFHIRPRGDDSAVDPVEPLRILSNALAMMIQIADLQGNREAPSHE